MRTSSVWFFAVVLGVLVSFVSAFDTVPKYTLDLDKEPEDRWGPALEMQVATHGFNYTIGPFLELAEMIYAEIPNAEQTLSTFGSSLASQYPTHWREMKGIQRTIAGLGYPKYNMSYMTLLTLFYEIAHVNQSAGVGAMHFSKKFQEKYMRACTGILSLPEDKSRNIIHGRNLDESPRTMRNLTLDITVVKNGTYQYSVFDYTWLSTGFYTSNRVSETDGLTLEENWRNVDNPSFLQLFERISKGSFVPIAFMFRQVQEQQLSFPAAVSYLTNITLASPGYVIMSGPKRRGAILSLSWNKVNNVVEYLNDTSSVTFKVQTNYDRWLPDPVNDPRRTVAEHALTKVGRRRSGTDMGVWMALGTYPVHNPDTLFTAMMRCDQETEGFTRQAMLPDGYWKPPHM